MSPQSMADFTEHYGITVLPTRAYRPRDKALVENAVRILYTRVYVKVRRSPYNNLTEMNAAIQAALQEQKI